MHRNEDGATLADMLQAPDTCLEEKETVCAEMPAESAHSALAQCRLDEQEYARITFEIDYTPVVPEKQVYCSLLKKERRADNLMRSIKRTFSKHPQVVSLIQRERCVL
jgi:hypothetical protein